MKAFTDIEQSKKLAKILPIESADMYWFNRHIDLTETEYKAFVVDKSDKHIDFFNSYAVAVDDDEIIPCWSLAALLNISPYIEVGRELYGAHHGKWYSRYTTGDYQYKTIADNIVDACYETILKLHEKKLL